MRSALGRDLVWLLIGVAFAGIARGAAEPAAPAFRVLSMGDSSISVVSAGNVVIRELRLEIAVNEGFVEPTVEAICRGARSGEIGDGKIFIVELGECVRIRTGERGNEAIG